MLDFPQFLDTIKWAGPLVENKYTTELEHVQHLNLKNRIFQSNKFLNTKCGARCSCMKQLRTTELLE